MVWYGMVWYGMVWYGMVEVCEGAPVTVSGWVLTDMLGGSSPICWVGMRAGDAYSGSHRSYGQRNLVSFKNLSNF